jgi:hypothetical protein
MPDELEEIPMPLGFIGDRVEACFIEQVILWPRTI